MAVYVKKQEQKNMTRSAVALALILAEAIFAILYVVYLNSSLGWFASNSRTTASGLQVVCKGDEYNLAVAGTNVGAQSYVRSGPVNSPVYTPSEIYSMADSGTTANALTNGLLQNSLYTTGAGNGSIKWRITDAYDDKGLGPNSQGAFTFYVIPKSSGTFDAKFSIVLEGYTAEQDKNANGSFDVHSISAIDSDASADEKEAIDFLHGHLLFFGGRVNTGTQESPVYAYTDLLDLQEFTLSQIKGQTVTATANTPIEVTVYWVWANTFGQMVFSAAENEGRPPVANDIATRTAIRERIVENPTRIFDGMTAAAALSKLAVESGGEYTFSAATVAADNHFAELTLGYNKADQQIGTQVKYLLVVLDAA